MACRRFLEIINFVPETFWVIDMQYTMPEELVRAQAGPVAPPSGFTCPGGSGVANKKNKPATGEGAVALEWREVWGQCCGWSW